MIDLLKKNPIRTRTDRDFGRYLHLNERNHPSSEQYMRARKSLLGVGQIKVFGMNRKGSLLYQLEDRSDLPPVSVSKDDVDQWEKHRNKNGVTPAGEKENQGDTKLMTHPFVTVEGFRAVLADGFPAIPL
jgi:hypothetical protein